MIQQPSRFRGLRRRCEGPLLVRTHPFVNQVEINREVVRLVNLKCFDKTDGSIVWEFGPCFGPVQQYGADYLHAFAPTFPIAFDTYVIPVPTTGDTITLPNRNSVTLSANAASDCVDVVRLNHDDGTEANRTTLDYIFAYEEYTTAQSSIMISNGAGARIESQDGLSGGDMLILGCIDPQIELTDFGSNNTTKTYIFHAHTMRAGNITFKTRVSDQTISFAYNASAATVETAIESVGDVASATVTGGPWPFLPLSVSVTWTSSSGDFKSVNFQPTYVAGFSDRDTDSNYIFLDPTDGTITNALGPVFGDYSSAVKLHSNISGLIPTTPDAVDYGGKAVAGASNTFVVQDDAVFNSRWWEGWSATTLTEIWCIYNNYPWAGFSSGYSPCDILYNRSQNGNVLLTHSRRTLGSPAVNTCGATVNISTGAKTIIDHANANLNNNRMAIVEQDGSASTYGYSLFQTIITQPESFGSSFTAYFDGRELDIDGNLFRVGTSRLYGLDASDFFCLNLAETTLTANYRLPLDVSPILSGTNARGYLWRFYLGLYTHSMTGTEFRFKFTGNSSNPTAYSGWIDWDATEATIEAALAATFPANTAGLVDNVQLYPFGAPAALDNTTSYLERYIEVIFAGARNATGITEQYIPATYVQRSKITLEFRTVTPEFTPTGIASFDRATGALNWSRAFGSVGASPVPRPTDAWLRGDYIYAYGSLVDNELP